MNVNWTDINKIYPYDKNPRKNDSAVDKTAASLVEFGWQQPIVVDSESIIVVGHTRHKAALKLGMEKVPVVMAEGLSPEQVKAYRITDNKTGELAEWDGILLGQEFEDLKVSGFDIEQTGFEIADIEDLLGANAGDSAGLTDDDEVPEAPEDPVSKLGDLWTLGDHRVLCGDSTDIEQVSRMMGEQKADMVFTDPPYGVSYQSNKRTKSAKFPTLKNDDKFLDITHTLEMFSTGWVFVWTSWKVQSTWVEMFKDFGYPTNIIIWHKPGGGIGDLKKTFVSDYEVALVWHRGAELAGKRIGSVWTINKDGASTYMHPTQKPVALPVEAIDKTTVKGAVVSDFFLGSGSALIACEKTDRKCYGMELDPKYCDVILQRWADFTGKDPVREDGVKFSELKNEKQGTA